MRAKVLKNHKQHKAGDVINLTPNEFHGLYELGVISSTKDMTADDYRIQADGIKAEANRLNKRHY